MKFEVTKYFFIGKVFFVMRRKKAVMRRKTPVWQGARMKPRGVYIAYQASNLHPQQRSIKFQFSIFIMRRKTPVWKGARMKL